VLLVDVDVVDVEETEDIEEPIEDLPEFVFVVIVVIVVVEFCSLNGESEVLRGRPRRRLVEFDMLFLFLVGGKYLSLTSTQKFKKFVSCVVSQMQVSPIKQNSHIVVGLFLIFEKKVVTFIQPHQTKSIRTHQTNTTWHPMADPS